jgi:ABC-type glycerol-3-phosphate transport system substrate-binding protein
MEKKLSRRSFLRLAGLAGGAAALTACQPQVVTQIVKETQLVTVKETQVVTVKETQMVEKVVQPTAVPTKAVKKVVVRYMCPTWCSTADTRVERQVAFRSVIDSFNQTYASKGMSVQEIPFDGDAVQLTQQIEQKKVDAIWFNHSEYVTRSRNKQLLAIDAMLGDEIKLFFPFVQDTMKSSDDKKIYALWHNTDTPLYYYNKAKIPAPPTKWSEVIKICQDVRKTEGGKKYAFIHPYNGWIQMNSGMFLTLGGQYLDKDNKPIAFDGKNLDIWKEMFDYYVRLVKEDLIPASAVNQDQQQMMPDVYAGNVYSFAGNSNYHVRQLKPNLKADDYKNWDAKPLPYPDKASKGIYQAGGWLIGAVATTDPDMAAAAAQWVIHATNEASQSVTNKAGAWIPTRSAILANDAFYKTDTFMQTTLKALENGHVVPLDPVWAPMSTAIQTALSNAVTGKKSIDEALKEAAATTMKEYEALKKK